MRRYDSSSSSDERPRSPPRSPRLGASSPKVSSFPELKKTSPTIPAPRSPPRAAIPAPRSPKITRSPPVRKIPIPQPKIEVEVKIEEPAIVEDIVGKKIEYRSTQIEWAKRSFHILMSNHGYIDTSQPRAGKTFIALGLAQKFGFRMLVICPLNVTTMWGEKADEYGIELIDRKIRKNGVLVECRDPIVFDSLRGTKGNRINHGLLERKDITTGGGDKVVYTPTEYYLSLVKEGLLVICDEIHLIKNDSKRYKACKALLHPIINGGLSRFGLLSGTPIDKQEQSINLLKLIGYIKSYKLYYKNGKTIVLEGAQELINACKKMDAQTTEQVLKDNPITPIKTQERVIALCYQLYIKVVKESISGAMPAITTAEGELDIKNGYYHIDPRKIKQLKVAIDNLDKSVGFLGNFQNATKEIEICKAFDMARVAEDILVKNQQNKVIICLNFKDAITEIAYYLEEYDPLILHGEVQPAKKRDTIRALFNDDPTRRLLLMTTPLALGTTLHSVRADDFRFMLISPSYKLGEIIQASYRLYGDGLKTKATVRLFYAIVEGSSEAEILERKYSENTKKSLNKKSEVLEQTLETNLQGDIILPNSYGVEYEK